MKKPLAQIRRSYEKSSLSEKKVKPNPFDQFKTWFNQNLKTDPTEPTAMVLATADNKGRPSSRVVLLKGYDEKGFMFFTNYESRKGNEMKANPRAAILFYWPASERQIRIEGKIKKVNKKISEHYFHQRPRQSQLSAWTSEQSSPIPDRNFIEKTLDKITGYFKNEKELPLPPFWGGYILEPDYFEFWQGRKDRLHDRITYRQKSKNWIMSRLAP